VYIALKNELADQDIKINYLRYQEQQKKHGKIQEDIERYNMEREAVSAHVSTTSADNERTKSARRPAAAAL